MIFISNSIQRSKFNYLFNFYLYKFDKKISKKMYQLNVPNMKDSFSQYVAEEECKIEIRNDDNMEDSKSSGDEETEIDPHE